MNKTMYKQYPALRRKKYRLRRHYYMDSAGANGASGGASSTNVKAVEAERDKFQARLATMQDQMLRARADYENFRKRTTQQQKQMQENATENVVHPMLSVIDHFALAIQSAEGTGNLQSFVDGVKIIYREMLKVLQDMGLQEIPTDGVAFDPHLHEAVGIIERDDMEENSVVAELRKGFKLGDRVIRPSLVHVSKKPN